MKRSLSIFLQVIIVLVGIAALIFLSWEPHIEGRNAHATVYQIYFNDPFLAYAYIASFSFFIALYQACKVLGLARQNKVLPKEAIKRLKTIKYCAIAMIGFVAFGEIFIMLSPSDDRAGGVFMGVLVTLGAITMATSAAKFERNLQKNL